MKHQHSTVGGSNLCKQLKHTYDVYSFKQNTYSIDGLKSDISALKIACARPKSAISVSKSESSIDETASTM
jgi:hypothetical protein